MLLTGLDDEELGESSQPPAHMVIWRKKHNSSSAALMASTSHSRNPSQSTSLFFGVHSQDGSKRHTASSYTAEMLQAYYNPMTPPSKPDDTQATSSQTTLSTRAQQKESQTVIINQLVYPIDDEPSTSSQPLMDTNSKITQKPSEIPIHTPPLRNAASPPPSSPPPKLPKHKEFEYFSS
jgi:hypothetical protein